MPTRIGVGLALCAVLGSLASCGGGDSTSPPVAVSSVTVSLSAATVAIGATVQATAVVKDADGATLTGRAVSWSSSNPTVLTVNASTGVATALTIGTANIIATSEGVTGQALVTVTPPPVNSVTVTLATASIVVGATVQATAVLKDATGTTLSGRAVTWTSSNPAVATVVATSGLATAVSAGTANIVATSEGVSGQAALTVTAPPFQVGTFALTDPATGAAVNLSNVAGTVRLRSALQVPSGTAGTFVVKIDGREVGRKTVTASLVTSAFAGLSSASAIPVDVETPVVVSTISYNEIANTGIVGVADILNGPHTLTGEFTPNGATTPAATGTASITTANPDVFTGRVNRTGSLRSLNGNSWSSGDLALELVPIRFGAANPANVTVLAADYQPVYGSSAINGVINIATKSGTDISSPTTLPRSTFTYESRPDFGSRMYLGSYTFGSTTTSPQVAEPNLNGNCVFTGGTGFIPSTPVTLPSLPQGCNRWITYNAIPQNLLGTTRIDISQRFYHDTKPPTALAGAFTLPDRTSGADQNAFFRFSDTYGVVDNWIGRGLLDVGIDRLTKMSDAGSGIDPGLLREFYFGTTPTFTPGASNRFTRVDELTETGGQRTIYIKAGVTDGAGNLAYVPLTTSLRNPYTVGGALSTNFGVDPALIGVSRAGGTFTVTGPANGYVTKSSSSSQWNLSLSGSLSGYAANGASWYRAHKDDDVTKVVYGEVPPSTAPWWMGATGGTTSTSSLNYSALISQGASRFGGTGEGAYTINFGAVDRGGNVPTGSPFASIRTIYDITPPAVTITGNGPITPGATANFTIQVTDNVGGAGFAVGPVFNLPHTGFAGGFAYTTPGQIPIGTFDMLTRNFTFNLSDIVPDGMVFYNPTSGALDTRVYNTIGLAAYARDWAYNYSPVATRVFTNNASPSVPADPSAIRWSVGSSSGCNGTGCAGGLSSSMTVTASWDSPSMTNPFNKFELHSLSGDGRAMYLATAPTATRSTLSANLFRYSTTWTYDWSTYCGPTGNLQLFGLGQSLNRRFWYKPSSFSTFSLSVPTGGNPYCSLAHNF